ncbi:MAG: copper resistance protein B [Hyphomonadaceae bacterium]|nr:copper resistance protein B [Hyphomonadaceae bacterium]
MRVIATALAPILLTIAPAAAQDHSAHTQTPPAQVTPAQTPDPHAGHDMQMPTDMQTPSVSAAPGRGPADAADRYFDPAVMARAREQLRVENGEVITHAVILDRLEATFDDGDEGYAWDVQGWYGGDINRFWWKSEGEGEFDGDVEHAELQLLYSRAITPYFDLQGGVRQTYRPEGDRTDLVLGVQGLAPYWFEVDGALFISNEGEVTARAQAEYDLRLTQRLILQPRAEVSLSAEDIPEFAIGAGVSNVLAGARLRYEITRSFAPYVGVEWSGAVGDTRDLIKANGDDPDATRVVLGVRALF